MVDSFGKILVDALKRIKNLWFPIGIGALASALFIWAPSIILELTNESVFEAMSLPLSITLMLLWVVHSLFFGSVIPIYVMIVVYRKEANIPRVTIEAAKKIVPMYILGFWLLVKSHIWIPLIGLLIVYVGYSLGIDANQNVAVAGVLAAIGLSSFLGILILSLLYLPRMVFASIILVLENKKPKESIELSIQRTFGYHGKIINSYIFYILISSAITFIGTWIYTYFFGDNITEGNLPIFILMNSVTLIVQHYMTALGFAFVYQLAATIFKHPQKA